MTLGHLSLKKGLCIQYHHHLQHAQKQYLFQLPNELFHHAEIHNVDTFQAVNMGCLGQCHHSDMSDNQNNVKNNFQKHRKNNIKNFIKHDMKHIYHLMVLIKSAIVLTAYLKKNFLNIHDVVII